MYRIIKTYKTDCKYPTQMKQALPFCYGFFSYPFSSSSVCPEKTSLTTKPEMTSLPNISILFCFIFQRSNDHLKYNIFIC